MRSVPVGASAVRTSAGAGAGASAVAQPTTAATASVSAATARRFAMGIVVTSIRLDRRLADQLLVALLLASHEIGERARRSRRHVAAGRRQPLAYRRRRERALDLLLQQRHDRGRHSRGPDELVL